jgi:hypothetical protein
MKEYSKNGGTECPRGRVCAAILPVFLPSKNGIRIGTPRIRIWDFLTTYGLE